MRLLHSSQTKIKATEEYFSSNASMDCIAKKYGMTGGNLRNWIIKNGMTPRTNSMWKVNTDREKEAVMLYKSNGIQVKDIAKKYNVSRRTITEWIKKHGLVPITYCQRIGIKDDMKIKAIELYSNENMNCVNIGKILNVSSRSVLDWISKAGIKKTASEIAAIRVLKNGANHKKYNGKKGIVNNIRFDSLYERDRIIQLSDDANVKSISRCNDLISYIDADGKRRTYNPDLEVCFFDGSIRIEEIKPAVKKILQNNVLKFKAASEFYGTDKEYIVIDESVIYKTKKYAK